MTTTSNTLRVAAAQISSAADPQTNLAAITDALGRADGADLVVFPEASMARFGTDLRVVAQPIDGAWANDIRELARQAGTVVVVGMFEPAPDGRVFNTLIATGPGVDAVYRKIHLFDAFGARESDLVAPGRERVAIEVGGVRVGLATCFDLRFADQFTALGRDGAELVVVPASWGAGPGKEEQWDLLTRARATDAQAWLLACDQAWAPPNGSDPLGVGRTVLVDPLGEVRARLGQTPGLLRAEVDVDVVRTVRERVPVL